MGKKEKLIEAAKGLIDKNGYDNISVSAITECAGVAKGTFYTYFKKKEDIISAITIESFEKIRESVSNIKGGILEKLKKFYIKVFSEIEEIGIEICRAWLSSSIKLENNSGIYTLKFYIDTLNDFLNEAIRKNELKKETPVNELTMVITSFFYGLIDLWCIKGESFDLLGSVEVFVNTILPQILGEYEKNA